MINGERIRQARELRGFTQQGLAEQVGVNQSAIAQLEAGRTQPSPIVLQSISFATGFPASFFQQGNGPDFPLGSLLFRAHANISAQKKNQAWRYGELLNEVAEIMSARVEPRSLRLSRLSEDPTSAARTTRSDLGLSPDRPIPNLTMALEKAGVSIFCLPIDLDERDAYSGWSGHDLNKPLIVLSSGRPGDRLRFSLAHELGHLVMHWSQRGEPKDLEEQANWFAGEFLLPEAAMRSDLLPPVTLMSLAKLKPKWGVSIQALVRRAKDLQIISPRRYHYLYQQLGAHGWRVREPENLDIPLEQPRAFRKTAEVLYGYPIDTRKMAEDLSLTTSFVNELLGVHADRPSPAIHANKDKKVVSIVNRLRPNNIRNRNLA
jgi:Zn-dependent peptidase ImmA (M78 family)/DNA-binding XRE family transcriptional regulator